MSIVDKTVTISGQYYTTVKGPLDPKQTPADTYDDLKDTTRLPLSVRYVGMTVTVLNSATSAPVEYWLVGGRSNASWKLKTGNIVPTKADLLLISPSACTVGLEMTVRVDESNDNKLTKYWVTDITSGVVTWERQEDGVAEQVQELQNSLFGDMSGETPEGIFLIQGNDVNE